MIITDLGGIETNRFVEILFHIKCSFNYGLGREDLRLPLAWTSSIILNKTELFIERPHPEGSLLRQTQNRNQNKEVYRTHNMNNHSEKEIMRLSEGHCFKSAGSLYGLGLKLSVKCLEGPKMNGRLVMHTE